MAFHSVQYLLFLCVAVLVYYATPFRARWIPLLAFSCAFYMSWRPEFVLVLFSIIAIQYLLALRMGQQEEEKQKRWYLFASLAVGLGLLVYFKYATAFRLILLRLLTPVGGTSAPSPVTFLVPIGISFYTLQTIGYLIDVYHGRRQPEKHFGIFAVFVSFFPIVLSGPIERADHLLPQLQKEERVPFLYGN